LKSQFPKTAPLVPQKRSHHAIGQPGVPVQPVGQVFYQFGSSPGVALFQPLQELHHSSPRSNVLLLMPRQRAITRCPHEPFFMREVVHYAIRQMRRVGADIAAASERRLEIVESHKDLLVFAVEFRNEHRMGRAPFQVSHAVIVADFGVRCL
jgi:hypothetical protein